MFRSLISLSLVTLVFLFSGCGSSSSSDPYNPPSDSKISGTVTDERVSGAKVFAYSDKDMNTLIASGTTTTSGAFDITLNGTEPSIVYFKTEGGLNIDDKMPAPTMKFAGTKDANGKFNISPISDILYQEVQKGKSLSDAKNLVAGKFANTQGINSFSESDLFADPTTDNNRKETLSKILASGTATITIPDGSYRIVALHYSKADIGNTNISSLDDLNGTNYLTKLDINISDGYITGTVVGASGVAVKGAVSGSNVLINLISSGNVAKIAGTIGLFGSTTGTFVDMSTAGVNKGVFAAQFIPSSGVDYTHLETKIAEMITGPVSYIFRDYIGGGDGMSLGSCDLNITSYNSTDHNFTLSGYQNHVDNNSTPAGYAQANAGVSFSAGTGKMLMIDGHLTSIALIKNSNGGDSTYLVKPIGVRGGVDMLVNNATSELKVVGDAIFNRTDVIAPTFEVGPNTIKTYVVTPDLLNQDRTKLTDANHTMISAMTIPSGFSAVATVQGVNFGNITMRLSKGVVAMYRNIDNNFSSSSDFGDYLRILQFNGSGAFQGEHINGGSIPDGSGGTIKLKEWPMPFVGNMHKTVGGSVPSAFTGKVNYMARTLYTTDTNLTDYLAFGAGTINISGGLAKLTVNIWVDGNPATPDGLISGTKPSFDLTADFDSTYGIYHIHGVTGDTYTDIIWPIGTTKAIYISTYSTTDRRIREIGEAFISF